MIIAEFDHLVAMRIGVTDASIVVLAERHATRTLLTLDRRHFSVLRPIQRGRFKLLP